MYQQTLPTARQPAKQPPRGLPQRYRGEHPLKTLLQLYGADRGKLALAFLVYIVKHSPVWIMPLLTARIIDIITHPDTHAVGQLWVSGAILAVVLVQNIGTHYLYIRLTSSAIRQLETTLRAAISYQVQHLSIGYYHQTSPGRLQSKLLRDVEMIGQLTTQVFQSFPSAILTLIVAITVTAFRAPWFLVFFLLTIPVAVALIRGLRKPIEQRNGAFRREIEQLSSRMTEMVQLVPVTRAHGVEHHELERIEQSLEEVRSAGLRLDSINAVFGAAAWVIFQSFNALCLVVAGYICYRRILPLTVGDVVLLTGYFNTLTGAVMELSNLLPQISKGFESIRSIGEVLECPDLEQNAGKAEVDAVSGEFRFERVSFCYNQRDHRSLDNFDLVIPPGETIAIVGPSGSGKSTLLNLVIGFLRPTSGRILLDGQDMSLLDLRTYRRFLSVVPQETVVFDGTIRDNILYGVADISEERLQAAARDAHVLEFTDSLPNGLDTIIGEGGMRLSGGQRQRIAIARALIRDPRVLVLDEATSALDAESEALIQQALQRLMQNRTTFVVAHRLSTIRNASRIAVLDQGRIVELGTHDELLVRNGHYARLRRLQADGPGC